jgi:hypothetical protein
MGKRFSQGNRISEWKNSKSLNWQSKSGQLDNFDEQWCNAMFFMFTDITFIWVKSQFASLDDKCRMLSNFSLLVNFILSSPLTQEQNAIPPSVEISCQSCFAGCESLDLIVLENHSIFIIILESTFSWSVLISIPNPRSSEIILKSRFEWCDYWLAWFESKNPHFRILCWNRFWFRSRLNFFVNHVLDRASCLNRLCFRVIRIWFERENQHFHDVNWNRLIGHQWKFWIVLPFRVYTLIGWTLSVTRVGFGFEIGIREIYQANHLFDILRVVGKLLLKDRLKWFEWVSVSRITAPLADHVFKSANHLNQFYSRMIRNWFTLKYHHLHSLA